MDLLLISLGVFTVVAVLGLLNAGKVFAGKERNPGLALLHGLLALIGSVIVIYAYIAGDHRVISNIIMAVVIIGLGFFISVQRRGGNSPAAVLVVAHAGIAVACYLLLAIYTFKLFGM